MRWAMARDDPFAAFDADFKSRRTPLYNNYRSSAELVRIPHVLAQALDTKSVKPVFKTTGTIVGESRAILDFPTPEREAERLAAFVASEMAAHNLGLRDFVRQKATDYAAVLQSACAAAGISLRNEAEKIGSIMVHELLAEEASKLLISVLRLATTARAGRHWTECQQALGELRGIGPDDAVEQSRFVKELDAYATRLGRDYPTPSTSPPAARKLVDDVVGFIGRGRLVAAHPAYGQGDWLEKVLASAATHLAQSVTVASNWTAAVDAYQGLHAIPLMTIHKSKGLDITL